MTEPWTDLNGQRHPDGEAALADDVVIIGAGPAGLTAAYQLAKAGRRSTVLESDNVVGGISRTVEREGWRFDIGGHRFFTKVQPWRISGTRSCPTTTSCSGPARAGSTTRASSTTTRYEPSNALGNLGLIEAVRCVLSYLWARVHPPSGRTCTRAGWRPASGGACTATSSRPTPRRSGVIPLGDARRLGGSTSEEPVADLRHRQRPDAQTEPEEHHLADRGVPVPQAGARNDVGALLRRR